MCSVFRQPAREGELETVAQGLELGSVLVEQDAFRHRLLGAHFVLE